MIGEANNNSSVAGPSISNTILPGTVGLVIAPTIPPNGAYIAPSDMSSAGLAFGGWLFRPKIEVQVPANLRVTVPAYPGGPNFHVSNLAWGLGTLRRVSSYYRSIMIGSQLVRQQRLG